MRFMTLQVAISFLSVQTELQCALCLSIDRHR